MEHGAGVHCPDCTRDQTILSSLTDEQGEPLTTTEQVPVEMVFHVPADHHENDLVVQTPVRCPDCGQEGLVAQFYAGDAGDAERQRIGRIMTGLVQVKRNQHHADHHEGQHAATMALWDTLRAEADPDKQRAIYDQIAAAGGQMCHHCRDGEDWTIGCVHCPGNGVTATPDV